MSDNILFRYNINKVKKILLNDRELQSAFKSERLIPKNKNTFFQNLTELLLQYNRVIVDNSIEDLFELKENNLFRELSSRFKEINSGFLLEKEFDFFKQLIYSYKYSTLKNFFSNNYHLFLLPLDYEYITNNNKKKLLFESFMIEFDKMTDIISEIENIYDLNKIHNDFIPYLIQIFGYQSVDDDFLPIESLRELAKNILEIYRIKGTSFSFELFFNFLGFKLDMYEYWFDKRLHISLNNSNVNPYTKSENPNNFSFYLTPIKPTEYIPNDMFEPFAIDERDITSIRNYNWFSEKQKEDGENQSVEKLLGLDEENPPEEGFDFTYFKTNIIGFDFRPSDEEEIEEEENEEDRIPRESSLDRETYLKLNAFARFLVPAFIHRVFSYDSGVYTDMIDDLILESFPLDNTTGNHLLFDLLPDLISKEKNKNFSDIYREEDEIFSGNYPDTFNRYSGLRFSDFYEKEYRDDFQNGTETKFLKFNNKNKQHWLRDINDEIEIKTNKKKFRVIFHKNNNEENEIVYIYKHNTIEAIDTPFKEDNTFFFWSENENTESTDFSKAFDFENHIIKEDINLYAIYGDWVYVLSENGDYKLSENGVRKTIE